MITVGIECEPTEQDTWGIARIISKTLEEISRRPDLVGRFHFILYFKKQIPVYPFLANPIFTKTIVRIPFVPVSFSVYYYILLPLKAWWDGVDCMYFPNYMLPLLSKGKSLVLSAQDVYYESKNTNIAFRYRLAYRIFGTWGARHATRVMAMSEYSRRELARVYRIDPERISVNHLAIDIPPMALRPSSPSRPYILFLGQAFPRRHLRETILAFERIAAVYPESDLRIVGTDKYTPPIIESLVAGVNQRLGVTRVFYQCFADDATVHALLRGAAAVAYISSEEAFGLPPLEALASGAVPVVADTPLSRELFSDAAIMVRHPDSVEEISGALATAMGNHDVRARILAYAPEITRRFTWTAHVDRLVQIFDRITRTV